MSTKVSSLLRFLLPVYFILTFVIFTGWSESSMDFRILQRTLTLVILCSTQLLILLNFIFYYFCFTFSSWYSLLLNPSVQTLSRSDTAFFKFIHSNDLLLLFCSFPFLTVFAAIFNKLSQLGIHILYCLKSDLSYALNMKVYPQWL